MNYMLLPLKRYAQFSGRSRRKEYWMFWLFQVLVYAILITLMMATGSAAFLTGDPSAAGAGFAGLGVLGLLYALFSLAMLIPQLAVTVRRLHDTNRTGWWILAPILPYLLVLAGAFTAAGSGTEAGVGTGGILGLVGILAVVVAGIALFVFMLLEGTRGPNNYGPDPKGADYGEVFG